MVDVFAVPENKTHQFALSKALFQREFHVIKINYVEGTCRRTLITTIKDRRLRIPKAGEGRFRGKEEDGGNPKLRERRRVTRL